MGIYIFLTSSERALKQVMTSLAAFNVKLLIPNDPQSSQQGLYSCYSGVLTA